MKTETLYRFNIYADMGEIWASWVGKEEEFEYDETSNYTVYRQHTKGGTLNVPERDLEELLVDFTFVSGPKVTGCVYIREARLQFKDQILERAESDMRYACVDRFGRW